MAGGGCAGRGGPGGRRVAAPARTGDRDAARRSRRSSGRARAPGAISATREQNSTAAARAASASRGRSTSTSWARRRAGRDRVATERRATPPAAVQEELDGPVVEGDGRVLLPGGEPGEGAGGARGPPPRGAPRSARRRCRRRRPPPPGRRRWTRMAARRGSGGAGAQPGPDLRVGDPSFADADANHALATLQVLEISDVPEEFPIDTGRTPTQDDGLPAATSAAKISRNPETFMTFTEAAVEVLKREGKPLHFRKIAEIAIRENLLDHVGKIPEDTMADQLAAHCKLPRPDRAVVVVQHATFALEEWGLPEDPVGLEKLVEPPPVDEPPYRPRERHPIPARELARASGRDAGRGRRREEGDEKRRRFPPPAEVAYEILAGAERPLTLRELASLGAERMLMPDAFVRDAGSLAAALREDNRRRGVGRPQAALLHRRGERRPRRRARAGRAPGPGGGRPRPHEPGGDAPHGAGRAAAPPARVRRPHRRVPGGAAARGERPQGGQGREARPGQRGLHRPPAHGARRRSATPSACCAAGATWASGTSPTCGATSATTEPRSACS